VEGALAATLEGMTTPSAVGDQFNGRARLELRRQLSAMSAPAAVSAASPARKTPAIAWSMKRLPAKPASRKPAARKSASKRKK
jgi:hypothetical protein